MSFGDSDLAALFADMGVPCTIADVTVQGLVERPDDQILAGVGTAVVAHEVIVYVPTGSLEQLRVNALITIDGEQLRVREVMKIEDGAVTRARCSKR
jgi:hypothetical protein